MATPRRGKDADKSMRAPARQEPAQEPSSPPPAGNRTLPRTTAGFHRARTFPEPRSFLATARRGKGEESSKARQESWQELSPPPAAENATWPSSTSPFRAEARAVLAAAKDGGDDAAATADLARALAQRNAASPLALHVFGHVLSCAAGSAAAADGSQRYAFLRDALWPLQRAAELAPDCLEIAFSLATVHVQMRNEAKAATVCRRALALPNPSDPALHSAGRREIMSADRKVRIAVAREQLARLLADFEQANKGGVESVSMLKTGYFCLPPMRRQTNVELAVLDPRSEEHCRNAIGTPANENLHNWPQVVELDPSGSCELDLVSDTSSTPPEDELVICYARYCSTRARVRLQKKNSEICHICYFKFGRVKSLLESNMEEHVSVKHHMDGFLCEARGCMVRAETRANAGLHQFFCHEQDKDEWWKEYLKDAPTR